MNGGKTSGGNSPAFPFSSHYPNVLVVFSFLFFDYCSFLFHLLLSLSKHSGCLKGNPLWSVSCYRHSANQQSPALFLTKSMLDTRRPIAWNVCTVHGLEMPVEFSKEKSSLERASSSTHTHTLLVSSDHQVRRVTKTEWHSVPSFSAKAYSTG